MDLTINQHFIYNQGNQTTQKYFTTVIFIENHVILILENSLEYI